MRINPRMRHTFRDLNGFKFSKKKHKILFDFGLTGFFKPNPIWLFTFNAFSFRYGDAIAKNEISYFMAFQVFFKGIMSSSSLLCRMKWYENFRWCPR